VTDRLGTSIYLQGLDLNLTSFAGYDDGNVFFDLADDKINKAILDSRLSPPPPRA